MRRFRRRCCMLLVLFSICAFSGCASLDFLHPNNTWRLNRGPALDQGDAYFSISDPAATAVAAE